MFSQSTVLVIVGRQASRGVQSDVLTNAYDYRHGRVELKPEEEPFLYCYLARPLFPLM
jgi:hypothetical protein